MINRVINDSRMARAATDLRGRAASAMDRFGPLRHRALEAVVEHPKISLFAALAAGALLGWIVKRR